MVQRSEEWYQARCGKVTSSRANDVGANGIQKTVKCGKCGAEKVKPPQCRCGAHVDLPPGKAYYRYLRELVAERFTQHWEESPQTYAMEQGILYEPVAIESYEFIREVNVEQVDFITRDGHPNIGCSPDGLVGNDGIIEVKSPLNREKHLFYILDGIEEHLPQILFQFGVTGRQWCDFISYHYDDAFGPLQLYVTHVSRTLYEKEIARLMHRAERLDVDVQSEVERLHNLAWTDNA